MSTAGGQRPSILSPEPGPGQGAEARSAAAEALGAAEALLAAGDLAGAEAGYRRTLGLDPDCPEALRCLGLLTSRGYRTEEAVALLTRARAAYLARAGRRKARGRIKEAASDLTAAASLAGLLAEALLNFGVHRQEAGDPDGAVAAFRQALALRPDMAEAKNNLGRALRDVGLVDEALAVMAEAVGSHGDSPVLASNRLLFMNYAPRCSQAEIFAASRGSAGRLAAGPRPPARPRQPGEPLRLGFVSPDFRRHPVSFFFEAYLAGREKAQTEVICYHDAPRSDQVTARLKALADGWRDVYGVSDAALAEAARADRLDIVVDLAGHTAFNRLPAFALGLAPVQVTWLGYPNTTGLAAMDFRVTDAVADPPGEADALHSERLWRLEHGFLCYRPPAEAPEPAAGPVGSGRLLTFGSFNHPAKLSDAALAAWADILKATPGSRLLLKHAAFAGRLARDRIAGRLARVGVHPSRLDFLAHLPSLAAHLAAYGQVDIALDPFPYNGTTTTCEALWMGVPVVCLRGDRHAARVGASLLTYGVMPELLAETVPDYVRLAAALAGDPAWLSRLRRALRGRLAASPVLDAAGFAGRLDRAFAAMRQTAPGR